MTNKTCLLLHAIERSIFLMDSKVIDKKLNHDSTNLRMGEGLKHERKNMKAKILII